MTGLKPIVGKPIQFSDKTDKTDKTSNGGPEKVGIGNFGSSVKGVCKAPLRSHQRAGNCKMTRKRDKKGRFKTKYDWKVLIPAILDEYIETETSLARICSKPGYPSYWQVWNVIKSNPEYQKEWGFANLVRLKSLDSDYCEIDELATEAFYDKNKDVKSLRLMLQICILRANNFERVAARHGYL